MERRLCYRGPESFFPDEGPEATPQTVESESTREREALNKKVVNQAKIGVIRRALDPDQVERVANDNFGEALPARLRAVSAKYGPLLRGEKAEDGTVLQEGIQQRLLTNLAGTTGNIRTEVRNMIDAIARPLPARAAQGQLKHRYVRISGGNNPKKPAWFGVDFKQIEADRKILSDLRSINNTTATPNAQLNADLSLLEEALNEFSAQDGLINDFKIRNAPNPINSTFLEVGRLTVILAGAGMTLLTGIVGAVNIKNRGLSAMTASALYGVITLLAAKPDLVKRVFGGKNGAYLDSLKVATEGKGLETASITYNATGPAWKMFAMRMMKDNKTTNDFLAARRKFGEKPAEDEKIIDRYVRTMMPDKGTARADLKRMITDGELTAFASRIMSVRDADAQRTVTDLIMKGTMQYGRVARADAEKADEELKAAEAAMPTEEDLATTEAELELDPETDIEE